MRLKKQQVPLLISNSNVLFYELCYYRQGAWYMDTSECDKFIFIGVSKKGDNDVFVHTMTRGDNDLLKRQRRIRRTLFLCMVI